MQAGIYTNDNRNHLARQAHAELTWACRYRATGITKVRSLCFVKEHKNKTI